MQISDIKQQVKRQDRYSIYLDGKYICSFSESELLTLGLRIGREINESELAELKDESMRSKARDRALNQLARRMRSEWELRDYLKRKEYTESIIDDTVSYLREKGYVNDAQFAQKWVDNRRLLKPISRRKLLQELKQKRVADDDIKTALAEDQTDEREVLVDLIERKRQQSRYQDETKLIQYLLRQGYNYEDIRTVINS